MNSNITASSNAYGGTILINSSTSENQTPKRTITITPLDYGYQVEVGCQKLAVEDYKKLVKQLELYLKDPKSYEAKWDKKRELL